MEIIAEIGYNHQGDIDIAKKCIDVAVECGADTAKFQKTDIESCPEWKNTLYNSENSFGKTYYEHRKYLEFGIEDILELDEYAEEAGASFLCSAKDYNSALLLSKHFEVIKLPSQMFCDNDTFNLLHSKGKTVYASTGMWTQREIEKSPWFLYADVVMHCVSVYPADPETVNLDMIRQYIDMRPGPVGYSSHEIGAVAVPFAVAAGASVIERHFTLDNTWKGSDHLSVSSDPFEFKTMVDKIHEVLQYMGDGKKFLTADEIEVRKKWVGYGVYNS